MKICGVNREQEKRHWPALQRPLEHHDVVREPKAEEGLTGGKPVGRYSWSIIVVMQFLVICALIHRMNRQEQQREQADSRSAAWKQKCAELEKALQLRSWTEKEAQSFFENREKGKWPSPLREVDGPSLTALYTEMARGLVIDTQLLTNETVKKLILENDKKWYALIKANQEARREVENRIFVILNSEQELPAPREVQE
jgi:hypothetical protein